VKFQLLFFVSILAMASCGDIKTDTNNSSPAPQGEASQPEKSSEVVSSHGPITQVRRRPEDVDMQQDRESQMTTIAMDGSSEEAFEASLQQFQETAPTDEYRLLKSAIQYLQVYDLGTRGNKVKLYEKLDGKTADEIVEMTKR